MKTTLLFLGAVIFCLSVSLWCPGRADAAPEEWKVLQESTYGGTFSYDVVSVKHTERNTVTVWARADAARYLYEIDCKNKKARILQGAGPSAAEWFPVTGGSADELLFHAVCPQLFP